MSVIKTYDKDGEQNGSLIPLWHIDKGPRIDQVYLTTLLPHSMKGPHLHNIRRGLFFCIRGRVLVVTCMKSKPSFGLSSYAVAELRPGSPPVEVPPGTPAAIYNLEDFESYVLNMPSPPWREGEEDEHEVKDWAWKP